MTASWIRIAGAFATQTAVTGDGALCGTCARLLHVRGAGITILDGVGAAPLCSSEPSVHTLDDLQFELGEGPCRDAYDQRAPVLVAHLDDEAERRWPMFTSRAQDLAVASVFAFPLRRDAACVGVLGLYHDVEGPLTPAQAEDATAVSDVLAEAILTMVGGGSLARPLDGAIGDRSEIHQATGMVVAQLDVTPTEALARIRGHAFSMGRTVDQVAADVVSRTLRLADDRGAGGSDG